MKLKKKQQHVVAHAMTQKWNAFEHNSTVKQQKSYPNRIITITIIFIRVFSFVVSLIKSIYLYW